MEYSYVSSGGSSFAQTTTTTGVADCLYFRGGLWIISRYCVASKRVYNIAEGAQNEACLKTWLESRDREREKELLKVVFK